MLLSPPLPANLLQLLCRLSQIADGSVEFGEDHESKFRVSPLSLLLLMLLLAILVVVLILYGAAGVDVDDALLGVVPGA